MASRMHSPSKRSNKGRTFSETLEKKKFSLMSHFKVLQSPEKRGLLNLVKNRVTVRPMPSLEPYADPVAPSSCPFAHGTPLVDPFPGYVHGKHPGICPHGCIPQLSPEETPHQKLTREAKEFFTLYFKEKQFSEEEQTERLDQVTKEINQSGTYSHTHAELTFGIQVSWRNAPKCINRAFWDQMGVVDRRDAKTNEEMFEAVKEHLRVAGNGPSIPALTTIFRPETPSDRGPRIWNDLSLRYAGYINQDGSVLGDPAQASFTQMIQKRYGWEPRSGKRTAFDPLPLLIQSQDDQPPELFELPPDCAQQVNIEHPDYAWFADLGLKWFAIPIISSMVFDIGGIRYPCAPFNGWYMVTEVAVRNFGDESRYNMLPVVAQHLGFDVTTNMNMWRDQALAVLCQAVQYSYTKNQFSIVDHHTAARSFYNWYKKELNGRGYCPGNWKWIIPPNAASTSRCYLELNKMTEYTLKPVLVMGEGWKKLEKRAVKKAVLPQLEKPKLNFGSAAWALLAVAKLRRRALSPTPVTVLVSTEGGETLNKTADLNPLLQKIVLASKISVHNVAEMSEEQIEASIRKAEVVVILTSTFNNGVPPHRAHHFVDWLSSESAKTLLKNKWTCVYGRGNSSYFKFCGAVDVYVKLLEAAQARMLLPPAKVDELSGEAEDYLQWKLDLLDAMGKEGLARPKRVSKISTIEADKQERGHLFNVAELLNSEIPNAMSYNAMLIDRGTLSVGVVDKCTECVRDSDTTGRSVSHLSLDVSRVSNTDLRFTPGDYINIWPENPSGVVNRMLDHLGLTSKRGALFDLTRTDGDCGDLTRQPFPSPSTYELALTHWISLCGPVSLELVKSVCDFCTNLEEQHEMQRICTDSGEFNIWVAQHGVSVLDLFEMFPSLSATTHGDQPHVPFEYLVNSQLPLRPRTYSIASSWKINKRCIDLVVGRHEFQPSKSKVPKQGLCSNFIAKTEGRQSCMFFELRACRSFQIPRDRTVPLIMVGTGSGIAPFRSFWQERSAIHQLEEASLGPACLIYGCRNENEAIFQEEIYGLLDEGVLTSFHLALSRPKHGPGNYVQNMIPCHLLELTSLIDAGAHIYVCGSNTMASSVRDAFEENLGAKVFNRLDAAGRYHEDAYGSTSSFQVAQSQ